MKLGRKGLALVMLASVAAPTALTLGCGHGKAAGVMVAPKGADDDERAYNLGYRFGIGDREHEVKASYSRHNGAYNATSESSFATGYQDGYSGVANRYHSPEASAWYSDPDESKDDD